MNNSPDPTIVINPLNPTKEGLENQLKDACALIGLTDHVKRSKTVFIKPNLTYPEYKKGVTTRIEFIRSLAVTILRSNPELKIIIGEGEGGSGSYSMTEAFKTMGFYELEQQIPQIKIINLSEVPARTVEIDTLRGPYKLELPEIFFTEIDFAISCPVPKVHCMTRITLSYKNQWGCLPDVMRLRNHYMFDYLIARVADLLKFKYAFLDGKYGLTTNGPMNGDPIEVNWFAASNSLGAFDTVVSEMMGFDWKTVGHLQTAAKDGFIPERKNVKIIGDLESLKRKFILKRDLWNYPALAAFQSKSLTDLVYLSKYAKFIHDIMYTFRKRPIT